MTEEKKKEKAKTIAESLQRNGYASFLARQKIESDITIFADQKEEIFKLVKEIMD